MTVQSTFWISYDLGVNGDYESLYSWLDTQNAKECGNSVAYLQKYSHEGNLMEYLRKEIENDVSLDKRSRIYVIRKENGKFKGSYLVGHRRAAPWKGYGDHDDGTEDCA